MPEEVIQPPEQPQPETPWVHIAPRFTVVPNYCDRVVDGILKVHGGSMDAFLQALGDAKVVPEDMKTMTDALERIETFLKSPPKDPDLEHLTLLREIELVGPCKVVDHPKVFLGTNEGDIVVATHERIIRFDKDGTLLFNTRIGHKTYQLIYEPIHGKVFFTQFSEKDNYTLHEIDTNGVVSEQLSANIYLMRVLPDSQGDLILVKPQGKMISQDLNISRFNPEMRKITVTHDVHISDTWRVAPCVLKNGVLVIYGEGLFAFIDTHNGTVKEMEHPGGYTVSAAELADGTMVCIGTHQTCTSYDVIDPSAQQIISYHSSNLSFGESTTSPSFSGINILPSGKILQMNRPMYISDDKKKDFFLQAWDVSTGTAHNVYEFPEDVRTFAVAPDGKILVAFESDWNMGNGSKIFIYG